jgi:putative membrane protein
MSHPWTLSLSGLLPFLTYFVPALVLVLVFGAVYSRLTPHNEFGLIKAGNSSAAIAFGGSLIGFVLPLCTAIVHAVSLLDFLIWGLIALIVQLLTFSVVRLFIPQLSKRIGDDQVAAALFVGLSSVAIGLVNAACMTPGEGDDHEEIENGSTGFHGDGAAAGDGVRRTGRRSTAR